MNIPEYIKLEMRMADLMARQEASGFRFDMVAAENVRAELSAEFEELSTKVRQSFPYYPGKRFTPKRNDTKSGYRSGAPMTKLLEFNPTSRQHIAWALTTFRGARFVKTTDSGKPQVDETVLSEIAQIALSEDNQRLHDECEMFIRLLSLQKWLGQLSEGNNSWFNTIEADGCIHHSCTLDTVSGRQTHKGPNLGQVNSAPWARTLFVPHQGMKMCGSDLKGIEARALAHYLGAYDQCAYAKAVLEGDVHQRNIDRMGGNIERAQIKRLLYAYIYGSGDAKLGLIFNPTASEAAKAAIGSDIRRKFLDGIPGLEMLSNTVKQRIRERKRLKAIDGRPIFCDAEYRGLNYLLQSFGACVAKMWCVIAQDMIDDAGYVYGIDYTRCAFVHDEQQFSVVPSETDNFCEILQTAALKAGEHFKLRIPIEADCKVGDSWKETH